MQKASDAGKIPVHMSSESRQGGIPPQESGTPLEKEKKRVIKTSRQLRTTMVSLLRRNRRTETEIVFSNDHVELETLTGTTADLAAFDSNGVIRGNSGHSSQVISFFLRKNYELLIVPTLIDEATQEAMNEMIQATHEDEFAPEVHIATAYKFYSDRIEKFIVIPAHVEDPLQRRLTHPFVEQIPEALEYGYKMVVTSVDSPAEITPIGGQLVKMRRALEAGLPKKP